MNPISASRDRAPFSSSGGSGMPSKTVATCARATSPSLRAFDIALSPPFFEVTSMGRSNCLLICFERSPQSRGSHRSVPSVLSRFNSGMASMNAPFASHETPRPLPDGDNRNSKTTSQLSLDLDLEHIENFDALSTELVDINQIGHHRGRLSSPTRTSAMRWSSSIPPMVARSRPRSRRMSGG